MNFRGGARARGRRTLATLEVTSLVDVVFLLIIFLLVTTTFKKNEYAFVVDLPTSSAEQIEVSTDKTTVFITKDGDMFLLEVPADRPLDAPDLDPSQKVSQAELKKRLAALFERRPDAAVAIRGEKDASYQTMMDVVGTLQETGFRNIWFPYEHQGAGSPPPKAP